MQYQGNLNAEYVQNKNNNQIYPSDPYGQPPSGQPLLGQPVGQYYPQQFSQGQYPSYINGQPSQGYPQYLSQQQQQVTVLNQGYQQVVVMPNRQIVVMTQPLNPIVAKEILLQQYSKYFQGCNCCFGVLALIFLIIRCVTIFGAGGTQVGAGVLYIISDFFFVIGVMCGFYALSRYVERMLLYYQRLLSLAMICEIAGSIIAFVAYRQAQDDEYKNNKNKYDQNNQDTERNVSLIFFIVTLVILVLAYGMFIRYARRIRFYMIDLFQTRQNLIQTQNQQGQQQ